jgi:hypothetical protein
MISGTFAQFGTLIAKISENLLKNRLEAQLENFFKSKYNEENFRQVLQPPHQRNSRTFPLAPYRSLVSAFFVADVSGHVSCVEKITFVFTTTTAAMNVDLREKKRSKVFTLR